MVWSWRVRIRGALVNGLLILTIFQDILKCCIVNGFQGNRFCTSPVNPVTTVGSAEVNNCHTRLIGLFFEINRIEKLINKPVGIVTYSGCFLAVIGSVEVIKFHNSLMVFRHMLRSGNITLSGITSAMKCNPVSDRIVYLGALLLLYGMVWGISRFNDSQKTWTMIACAMIGIAISMYSLLCREILEANVVQTFRLWIWLFYFILGSNMDKFTRFIQKYLSLRMHIFLAVIMTVLNIA